ncbi:TolC family protein [Maribacter sp. 2307UL18-2]|uniref:TolC family protein n=1 Tax=Maribacter sp. 2307UL18-2 TaxID=3386274 RepID=UPI0039BD40EE
MKKFVILLFFTATFLSFSQSKQTYTIGILVDFQNDETKGLLDKLKIEVRSVVGEDAILDFSDENILVNGYNEQLAQMHYEQLLANETDIILAFGPTNNQIIGKQKSHAKPTILFGAVNRDLSDIDFDKNTSDTENFTYLIESESYNDDLKKFKELTNFKKIGIAIEAGLDQILPLNETFEKEVTALDAEYKLIPFTTVSDITSNLEGLDALYMAGGFFLKEAQVEQLAQSFIKARLPSFTVNGPDHVREGIMATNQSDENLDQFFRRIALTIEAYINGTPLAELPVYIDYTPRLTINYNTAEVVGVPIKYSLIAQTDFVGDFKNAISEREYTLLTAIDQALQKNLNFKASEKDVALSSQDVKTAKSNYLPSLTASTTGTYIDPDLAAVSNGQNPEFSTAGNITLQQTLFSEAANANIVIQKNLQKAQEEVFNAAELDLIFDVSNAFFNALILKANAQIQIQNLDLTKRNLQIAQQNYEAGAAGKSDLLRFRSQLAQNTQAMVEAINQLEQGFVNLNQVLNNPVNMEVDLEDTQLNEGIFKRYNYDELTKRLDDPSLREPFIDFLVEEAYRNSPELKSLGYNLNATERNIRLNSFGRLLPTLGLQGQYNHTFNRSGAGSIAPQEFPILDNNYNVGVSLSIPIINQNQTNINRQTAIIQREQLQINQENTELAISSNIRSAVLSLVNQVSNIQLSKISEETAAEALELTQASYANGAVNIVQLLDAQNNYLNAQLASTTANYNFLISGLQLERFMGYYFLLNSEEKNEEFRQRFFEFLDNRN